MIKSRRRASCATSWAAAALGLLLSSARAEAAESQAKCQLFVVGELPVRVNSRQPIVDATINGKPARLLLDTGSAITSLFAAASQRLGLTARQVQGDYAYGAGGGGELNYTVIADLGLGKYHARNVTVMSLAPGAMDRSPVDGVIGEDLLSQVDVELDLPDGVVRLVTEKDCKGDQVVYWNKAYTMTPLLPVNQGNGIVVDVALNKAHVRAEIDSGASQTVATLTAASAAGVTPQSEGVEQAGLAHGIGAAPIPEYSATFPTFTIGDETIRNARIHLANLYQADRQMETGSRLSHQVYIAFPQMLLGADFLMAHRVFVARKQAMVYASYLGGPVFRDDAPPTPPSQDGRSERPAPGTATAPAH